MNLGNGRNLGQVEVSGSGIGNIPSGSFGVSKAEAEEAETMAKLMESVSNDQAYVDQMFDDLADIKSQTAEIAANNPQQERMAQRAS